MSKQSKALAKLAKAQRPGSRARARRAQDIASGAGIGGVSMLGVEPRPRPRPSTCTAPIAGADSRSEARSDLERCASSPVLDSLELASQAFAATAGDDGPGLGGLALAVAHTLISKKRTGWAKLVASWQTKANRREMERGQVAAARASAFGASSPAVLAELARELEREPTPYTFGKLAYAVCDIVATIEGDRPA